MRITGIENYRGPCHYGVEVVSHLCEVLETGNAIPRSWFDWVEGKPYWNIQGNQRATWKVVNREE